MGEIKLRSSLHLWFIIATDMEKKIKAIKVVSDNLKNDKIKSLENDLKNIIEQIEKNLSPNHKDHEKKENADT